MPGGEISAPTAPIFAILSTAARLYVHFFDNIIYFYTTFHPLFSRRPRFVTVLSFFCSFFDIFMV